MYKNSELIDKPVNITLIFEFLKIGIAMILLLLGIHVVLWVIDTIGLIVHDPANIKILDVFSSADYSSQLFSIAINGDLIEIKTTSIARIFFFLIIFIILFNTIGRIIAALFSSMVKILLSIRFSQTSTAAQHTSDYSCTHCDTPYNPSDYRTGTIMRCSNCNSVLQPTR